MMTANELGFAWKGALAAALVASACGKVADEHGGESHFYCAADDDCTQDGQVCVRTRPSDEKGVCRPLSEVTGGGGTDGGSDSGSANVPSASSGGTSTGGGSGSGSAGGAGGNSGGTSTGGDLGSSTGGTGGGSGSPIRVGECSSACCPTDEACYAVATGESGRECLALRDNTGQSRIQLRQTSTKTLSPAGLTLPIIQFARNQATHLPLSGLDGTPNCLGANSYSEGRFIQLLDIQLDPNLTRARATTGYSRHLSSATIANELIEGLCMAQGEFAGLPAYRLAATEMSDSSAYPINLPPPRGLETQPWQVGAVAYVRLPVDFVLATERGQLLERPAGGHYFYDEPIGRYHAYARQSDMVLYGNRPDEAPTIIPVREVETYLFVNDPAHPNCVGGVVTAETNPACDGSPEWAGKVDCNDGSCTPSEASAEQRGYMLITELEQVVEPTLQQTLCVVVMSRTEAEAHGFLSADGTSCKSDRWDPRAPNNSGLPNGDWCAATNAPATATCHDAFRWREQTTFAATKIRIDGETGTPAACPL